MIPYMIGFGRCQIYPVLVAWVGLPRILKNFPQTYAWGNNIFCIPVTPFNESRNKKAGGTDVMFTLLAPGYLVFFLNNKIHLQQM